jgi:hypothetical protein
VRERLQARGLDAGSVAAADTLDWLTGVGSGSHVAFQLFVGPGDQEPGTVDRGASHGSVRYRRI